MLRPVHGSLIGLLIGPLIRFYAVPNLTNKQIPKDNGVIHG
jgi:hypothetical protein